MGKWRRIASDIKGFCCTSTSCSRFSNCIDNLIQSKVQSLPSDSLCTILIDGVINQILKFFYRHNIMCLSVCKIIIEITVHIGRVDAATLGTDYIVLYGDVLSCGKSVLLPRN